MLDLDRADPRQGARGLGQCHRGSINGVAFSPDGERYATCGGDRTIRLWETATGASLHCLSAAQPLCGAMPTALRGQATPMTRIQPQECHAWHAALPRRRLTDQ